MGRSEELREVQERALGRIAKECDLIEIRINLNEKRAIANVEELNTLELELYLKCFETGAQRVYLGPELFYELVRDETFVSDGDPVRRLIYSSSLR